MSVKRFATAATLSLLMSCEGRLVGSSKGLDRLPDGSSPPVGGPAGPGPSAPTSCDAQPTAPGMRLLEKGDLLSVLTRAGLASPALGELFSSRPKSIALASPSATWQADDAVSLLDKTESMALALAKQLVAKEPACKNASSEVTVSPACQTAAVNSIARALFRRPPTAAITQRYQKAIVDEAAVAKNSLEGLAYGFELALQSPSFLYRSEVGEVTTAGSPRVLTEWELADALSLGIAGEPADAELIQLAENGTLTSPQVVKAQARRLALSEGGKERMWQFYERWLFLSNPAALNKDPSRFPAFNAQLASMAQAETKAFVLDSVYGAAAGGLRQLIAGDAKNGRVGVHTLPAFLMSQGGPGETRPLHLADIFFKTVVCQTINPPPPGAVMTPFTADPTKSPRQNFETRTSTGNCKSCHALLNPTGFAFDGFDSLGVPRSTLNNFPIDTAGSLELPSGAAVSFTGPQDLLTKLADTDDVRACHAGWLFRFAHGVEKPSAACELKPVADVLAQAAASPIDAMVELYASPSFMTRKDTP